MSPTELHDSVDLRTAASELGVHYQTAYGWVRSGRLGATFVGGRYLVERAEIQRVVAERATPRPPAPPSPQRIERHAAAFEAALRDGDETGARSLCQRLTAEGVDLVQLVHEVVAPALVAIGRSWSHGEIDIWVEHRASAIVERALSDITPNPRGRRRGTAVVAAVSGDRHVLPTIMATAALRSANWRVHHLGADTPLASIESFLDAHDIDLVVLSNTHPDAADATDRAAAKLRARAVRVLVGRPGASLADLVDLAAARDRAAS